MEIALEEARAAAARGEVPVGAAVTDAGGRVLARAGNRTEERHDASAHAEMLALRAAAAARGGGPRLPGCTLTVTLEPCPMCAQAASFFRVRRVVFGAYDPKGGGVDHGARVYAGKSWPPRPEVVAGRRRRMRRLLRRFFRAAPGRGRADAVAGVTGPVGPATPPTLAVARPARRARARSRRCFVRVRHGPRALPGGRKQDPLSGTRPSAAERSPRRFSRRGPVARSTLSPPLSAYDLSQGRVIMMARDDQISYTSGRHGD
jgi:tRNA(Arg) A34 adenosine deaminase TadA